MIKANFKAYASYVTDSLNQWDLNQVLQVTGLNLTSAPEVHFSNANTDRAIVRQSTLSRQVVSVAIPNSLLQDPLRIYAHIGVYEGNTFKVVELVEIPVKPRKRPADYQIQDSDEEIYSFKALENAIANMATKDQVANIVANVGSTAELVDVRYGADGKTYASAGEAVRGQIAGLVEQRAVLSEALSITGEYIRGTLNSGVVSGHNARVVTNEMQHDGVNDIVVTAKDGYRFAVAYYGHGGDFYVDTGWLTGSYTISAGSYWKMIIAQDPDNTGVANIAEYANAVIVSKAVSAMTAEMGRGLRKVGCNYGGPVYRAINHRGYNTVAPENTLPAFILSKKMGFDIVEADVRFTSDGYAVLLHDPTVDRTSNGSGSIANMTFSAVRALDFGSWKSEEYTGTQIPTFEEFVTLCKKLGLHIYCELEVGTEGNIRSLTNTVKSLGMERNVTWISFDTKLLTFVAKYLPTARLLINVNAKYWGGLGLDVQALRTPFNEVGLNYQYDLIDDNLLGAVSSLDITLDVWTVNNEAEILALSSQVGGIASDSLNCNDVFRKHYIGE